MRNPRSSGPLPDHHHPREPFTPAAVGARHHGVFNLLTAIPLLLGAAPTTASIVVVPVGGRRLLDAYHLPLPDPAQLSAGWVYRAWAMFLDSLEKNKATALTLVAYADQPWTDALLDFDAASPLKVLDLLRVHEDRWYALDCPNPNFCEQPECGASGTQTSHWRSPLVLHHHGDEAPHLDSSEHGHSSRPAPPGEPRDERIARLQPGPPALLEIVKRQRVEAASLGRERLSAAVCLAHDVRHDGKSRLVSPSEAAVLLRALMDPDVRDLCTSWSDEAATTLWYDLIPAAPPGWVAPVASLIAFTAYQRGDLLMADLASGHALNDIPRYGLAELVQGLLHLDTDPKALTAVIEGAPDDLADAHDSAPSSPPYTNSPAGSQPTTPIQQAARLPHHE